MNVYNQSLSFLQLYMVCKLLCLVTYECHYVELSGLVIVLPTIEMNAPQAVRTCTVCILLKVYETFLRPFHHFVQTHS